jgi:hypothetical protein
LPSVLDAAPALESRGAAFLSGSGPSDYLGARGLRRALLTAAALALHAATALAAADPALFFDDFNYPGSEALRAGGWLLREAPGRPGVPGAAWRADAVQLIDDPAQHGNRLLRLVARTDGSIGGTVQAQVCQARKSLYGTYAARVRLTDAPVSGAGGDPIIQTFHAASPLRHDFDPQFSEIDWAYLPNGGLGNAQTRIQAVAWQTVRIEPWQAHNQTQEVLGSQAGWHTLQTQVQDPRSGGRSRWFIDGNEVAQHGGRNHPVVAMAIGFSLRFSPEGPLPPGREPRVWVQDIDWVLYAADRVLTPQEVQAEVKRLRTRGITRIDSVPRPEPPVADRCDF